jgi:hypothetical protein
MKPIWKRIFAVVALPLRLIIFVFRGPSEGKGRLAGRYTRPAQREDIEPSANCLIG